MKQITLQKSVCSFLLFFFSIMVNAQTVNIPCIGYYSSGNVSNLTKAIDRPNMLVSGSYSSNTGTNGFARFDLSSLPSNAIITSASLTVRGSGTGVINLSVAQGSYAGPVENIPPPYNYYAFSSNPSYSILAATFNTSSVVAAINNTLSIPFSSNANDYITILRHYNGFVNIGFENATPGATSIFYGAGTGADFIPVLNISYSACSATTSSTSISICSKALPYTWNGTSYLTAGTYTKNLTNAGGCDSVATLVLSVINALQNIVGIDSVCVGSSIALTNTMAGGIWSSGNNRASVNPTTGIITGTNAGTAIIKYTVMLGSCTLSTTKNIAVNPIPSVPSIAYAPGTTNPQTGAPIGSYCVGRIFNVVGMPNIPAGTWSSTGIVSITNTGQITINATGVGSIKYTYIDINGCSNSRTISGNGFACVPRGVTNNEQLISNKDFTIYPNPTKSSFNLNVETLIGAGSIVVTDLYGKQVIMQALSLGINTIDMASFTKGMYLVSITTNEGKFTKKLIVE